jgi:hypothetical protein
VRVKVNSNSNVKEIGPGKKTSARRVSHAHPLLCFKFCFTLFLLVLFYEKYKKISILYSCFYLSTFSFARMPIPCKLVGIHDALENNFSWICPENPFDESSVPKCDHKGSLKTHLDTIQFIVEKTPTIELNSSFDIT